MKDSSPPLILYDIDGIPMAVHGHIAPMEALRVIYDEYGDHIAEMLDLVVYDETHDDYRLSHERVREQLSTFKHGWYIRSLTDPYDSYHEGDFDEDTWWPVQVSGNDAEPYTETGFG